MSNKNNNHKCLRVSALVFLASVVFLILINLSSLPGDGRADAAPASTTEAGTEVYDPVVLPISASEVQANLIQNSKNAQAEYQSLLRAGYQHQEEVAYKTMDHLRREQTENPIVLAGYYMALKMAEGGVSTIIYNGGHRVLSFSRKDEDEAAALLFKAYRSAPKLWLTYAIDGETQFYSPGGDRKKAVALLLKAEELAPDNPYPHWLLGNFYANPPLSQHKYEMAAEECKKALASGAKISNAAFVLFQIYSLFMPNQSEEIRWKRKFLSLMPPDAKINPQAKQWLDRYPG